MHMVSVDARSDRVVVASWWRSGGKYGHIFLGEWAERADEPVSDEELGELVRRAFKECRSGVPAPDFRDDPEFKKRVARLSRLANVRGQTAYGRGARHVSVTWDDATGEIKLVPHESDSKGGFIGLEGLSSTISATADDTELGSEIRRSIAASKSFT
jgi:hypothetical protein